MHRLFFEYKRYTNYPHFVCTLSHFNHPSYMDETVLFSARWLEPNRDH